MCWCFTKGTQNRYNQRLTNLNNETTPISDSRFQLNILRLGPLRCYFFRVGNRRRLSKTVTFTEVIRTFIERGQRCTLIAHREELIFNAWNTLHAAGITSGIIKGDHPTAFDLPCQVASIQTLRSRKNIPEPDIIVVDEGHHVQDDNTYGKYLEKYPNAKILVVSATPYRLSGKGFLNIVKGKTTHLIVNCTLPQLIEDGWLVPLRYLVASIPDLSAVELVKGEYNEEQAAKVMKTAPVVEAYLEHVPGKQGLCFANSVQLSKDFCKAYNEAGITAVHVDGDTPAEYRRWVYQEFLAKRIYAVWNVDIYTEGTDFPACDFVQDVSPTKSLSKNRQKMGRVTRAIGGIVDLYETKEERKAAIAASLKPHGIILDHSGAWREPGIGFPDDEVDWEYYFRGWDKPKRKPKEEEAEWIEIPMFEIEDPKTGAKRRTSNIKEVEGMVLVEITKELRANLKSMKHLKEFDRLYKVGLEHQKVGTRGSIEKPGYFAYYKFRDYCRDNNIDIVDAVWKYIRIELCDKITAEVEEYITQQQAAGVMVIPSVSADIERINKKGIHRYFLKKEWEAYKAVGNRPEQAQTAKQTV